MENYIIPYVTEKNSCLYFRRDHRTIITVVWYLAIANTVIRHDVSFGCGEAAIFNFNEIIRNEARASSVTYIRALVGLTEGGACVLASMDPPVAIIAFFIYSREWNRARGRKRDERKGGWTGRRVLSSVVSSFGQNRAKGEHTLLSIFYRWSSHCSIKFRARSLVKMWHLTIRCDRYTQPSVNIRTITEMCLQM